MDLIQTNALLAMGLVAGVNFLRYRDPLYPAFLHAVLWTGVLLLYVVNQDELLPLSPLSWSILPAGTLLFSAGCWLATRGHLPARTPFPEIRFEEKSWYRAFLFWTPVAGLPLFLAAVYALGREGPFESFYQNLRYNAITVEDPTAGGVFGITAYFLNISYASVFLQTLIREYRHAPRRYWTSVAVALVYAVLATGRTRLLLFLVTVSGIMLITRRVSFRKTVLLNVALFLAIFAAVGLLLGFAGGSDVREAMASVFDLLMVYAVGSLPAFDGFLHEHTEWTFGENTFRTGYAVLARLGLDLPVRPLVQEFAFVPFPINVYTVYQPYYADFSFAGLLAAPLLLGYLHGVLYRKATAGDQLFVVAYALSLFPLVMQFFQDQYFSLLSLWIQYAVLLVLFFHRFHLASRPARALA